jgi:hypothetical protein
MGKPFCHDYFFNHRNLLVLIIYKNQFYVYIYTNKITYV